MLRLYNTLTRKKEVLKSLRAKRVNIFVCGPTVYDWSHIGHARTYLAFDILVRYLRHQGFKVFYLQNITDVDDRIIDRARKKGRKPLALAKFFERAYLKDTKRLGITSVNRYARASDFVPEIVRQVKTLIRKGHAYKIEGEGYYFDISKFKDYGKLSKRTVRQANDAVSRIDESVKKRNKGDFALWKFYSGEPSWPSELGRGRPGWHIEDTAISEKFFGPQYDLHGGAVDLKFPHHEAEIAQQESASGKRPFVKIWLHTGFLLVRGEKMAKSLKNYITIRELLSQTRPEIFRLLIAQHHYRTPFNYRHALLSPAEAARGRLLEFVAKLKSSSRDPKTGRKNKEIKHVMYRARRIFYDALADDFNTPRALGEVFKLINRFNPLLNSGVLGGRDCKELTKFLKEVEIIFGVIGKVPPIEIPATVQALAKKREGLRTEKQWVEADRIRQRIRVLGWLVEDTPNGPRLKALPR